MPRVYETMRRTQVQATADPTHVRFVIRLWLDGHDLGYADHAVLVARELVSLHDSPYQAAQSIADHIPHLNAVEVVDADGNGSLIYPEWP